MVLERLVLASLLLRYSPMRKTTIVQKGFDIQLVIRAKAMIAALVACAYLSSVQTLIPSTHNNDVSLHQAKEFRIDGSIVQAIRTAALLHGIPPALVAAVIHAESHFNPKAKSSAGAKGLMQITSVTQQHLGLVDPFDPFQNIVAGSLYLSDLMKRFDGEVHLVLAAYNAGPGAVKRHNGVPPYRETRDYVRRVLKLFRTYQELSIFTING